jgi:type IV pilus assembly protein PilO
MALQDGLEQLQNFNIADLDPDDIGSWPLPVKAVLWVLAFVAVLILVYILILQEKGESLDTAVQREVTLKADFDKKVQEAANIDAYRKQMLKMNESFSALLAQLPKDTEVPGLLDDITNKGQSSGLAFDAIDLQPEKKGDFYVELPIDIRVAGGFHDFAAFVSGVAGLSRIVTLDDFEIEASKEGTGVSALAKNDADSAGRARSDEELTMKITAKTYRYKSAEEGDNEIKKKI